MIYLYCKQYLNKSSGFLFSFVTSVFVFSGKARLTSKVNKSNLNIHKMYVIYHNTFKNYNGYCVFFILISVITYTRNSNCDVHITIMLFVVLLSKTSIKNTLSLRVRRHNSKYLIIIMLFNVIFSFTTRLLTAQW